MKLEGEYKIMIYLFLKMADEVLEANALSSSGEPALHRSKYLIMKLHPLNSFMQADPRYQRILAAQKILYENNLRKYGDGGGLIN